MTVLKDLLSVEPRISENITNRVIFVDVFKMFNI